MLFYVKGFAISLLGIIFIILITSSVPSIAVDDSVGNNVVSEDMDKLNVVPTKEPKYQVYLHVTIRNVQGELINVAETLPCRDSARLLASNWGCTAEYMDHEITDYAFDTALGKKEIITIDNIKYEKVQFSNYSKHMNLFDLNDRELTGRWTVQVCGEEVEKFGFECAEIFQSRTSTLYVEMGDISTSYWTILRVMS